MANLRWDGDDLRNSQDSSGSTADLVSHSGKLQQGYRQGSLTEGLVAYYPMEKGEGEILHDGALDNTGQIKPGSNGENTSVTDMWVSGKIGDKALQFDGSDDHIKISENVTNTSLDLKSTDDFTISHWIYTHDNSQASSGSGNHNKRIWYIENSNSKRIQLVVNEGGKTYFNLGSSGAEAEPTTAFPENTWTHIVCVKRGSTFKIFKNGSDITTGSGAAGDPSPNTNIFWIGSEYDGSQINGQFDGIIDDFRIYKRALSHSEIKALYNSGNGNSSGIEVNEKSVPSQNQGGISRWKFDDDTDTNTAPDSWSNNNGTLTGTTYTTQKVYGNSALEFSKDNQEYVNIGQGYDTSEGTFSIWLNAKTWSTSSNNRFIISDRTNTGDYWQLLALNDGTMHFRINDGTNRDIYTNKTFPENTWHHFTATWGNKGMKLYANGTQVGENTYTNTWNQNSDMKLGWSDNYQTGYDFHGKLDETRYYNTALKPHQVEQLYHKGAYRIPRRSTLQ